MHAVPQKPREITWAKLRQSRTLGTPWHRTWCLDCLSSLDTPSSQTRRSTGPLSPPHEWQNVLCLPLEQQRQQPWSSFPSRVRQWWALNTYSDSPSLTAWVGGLNHCTLLLLSHTEACAEMVLAVSWSSNPIEKQSAIVSYNRLSADITASITLGSRFQAFPHNCEG